MSDERPLVVLTDEAVLDEVLRLSAAVGCELERAPDLASVYPKWARAPVVILDEDALHAEVGMPRRRGVVLVCKGTPAAHTWQRAFSVGVDRVISLPEDEADLVAVLADVVEGPAVAGGQVLAVLGGRGGAGASVLAASLGFAAAGTGADALLVDCDPLGGGVDLVLGAETDSGLRWPELQVSSGRVSMAALDAALPSRRHGQGQLSFISCDRDGTGPSSDAVSAVIEAGRRAAHTVVCDLPRHLDSGAKAAIEHADFVVVVVPAECRACVAARRVLRRIGERVPQPQLLVRGPAPDGLEPEQVAEAVGAPLLATMRPERGLDRALERGEFALKRTGPLAGGAHAVLAAARAEQVYGEAA